MNCSSCGSITVRKNGTKLLSNGIKKQRYLCKDCGRHTFVNTNTPAVITESMSTHHRLSGLQLATVFRAGPRGTSCTIVIPHTLAKRYGICAGDKIYFKEESDGLLIKKLEVTS